MPPRREDDEQRDWFGYLPVRWAMTQRRTETAEQQHLLTHMAVYARGSPAEWRVSVGVDRLAAQSLRSRNVVMRGRRELADLGLIADTKERVGPTGTSIVWRLCPLPSEVVSEKHHSKGSGMVSHVHHSKRQVVQKRESSGPFPASEVVHETHPNNKQHEKHLKNTHARECEQVDTQVLSNPKHHALRLSTWMIGKGIRAKPTDDLVMLLAREGTPIAELDAALRATEATITTVPQLLALVSVSRSARMKATA